MHGHMNIKKMAYKIETSSHIKTSKYVNMKLDNGQGYFLNYFASFDIT
jgi:hypothetical protein